MTTGMAHNGDVQIVYETFGSGNGEPLLLILGVGTQLIAWPEAFCAALVEAGFAVARFDNRDSGLSTHLTAAGRPSRLKLVLRPASAAPYGLADLAADAVAVLDALGWDRAHVLGMSQGGMIAQKIATDHPDRVRSLISIAASPAPRIGRPTIKTIRTLLKVSKKPITSAEDNAQHLLDLQPLVSSPSYPFDEATVRELGRASYERGHDQAGVERQSAAFQSSGDRRKELSQVRVPTLVVHGEADQMVRPAGGQATAAAIPDARLVTFPGMGHELPRPLWPRIIDEVLVTTGQASLG